MLHQRERRARQQRRDLALTLLLVGLLLVLGLALRSTNNGRAVATGGANTPAGLLPTLTVTACSSADSLACHGVTATISPTPCPSATPERFVVEPLHSPTNALSQTVYVFLGNAEAITITLESGTFHDPAPPRGEVVVDLLPNTTHHLTVLGRVRKIGTPPNCVYGGYTLSTTLDRNGAPLVIEQHSDQGVKLFLPLISAAPAP